jgi:hypothetical protein
MITADRLAVLGVSMVLLSGCGSAATDESTTGSASTAVAALPATTGTAAPSINLASTEEANVTPAAHFEPALQALVDQAIADLATRLGIDTAAIVADSAQFVVWPDKSLGCPQPGMGYNQVTVDGSLIDLRVGNTTYRYHSGGSRSPFLCEKY